ncbi:DNA replication and repair protein RecF [Ammonifex degensii KC4]|uniref:DNA replication and repair protein RecF n=1 Tax=Ammonifex degensii (strain DSM 10501 / KC4) TaxID=429009 RepID=C9RA71_AMMDK|nr:DNA replication and repair protein RecF [Ammonifex degensii]ACX51180.1 DNA replication and repair protein RecF [Ammonifex degensii KC4]
MWIRSLFLRNFRNYCELEWEPSSGINLLKGPNAAGKTNLLEALYFVLCGRSFRTLREEEIVRTGETTTLIKGKIATAWGEIETEVRFKKGTKLLFYQGKPASRRDFPGEKVVLLFRPEDLLVVTGTPAERRGFFNRVLAKLVPGYEEVLTRYQRALEQRNALLRLPEKKGEELEIWTEALVSAGALLYRLRVEGLGLIGPLTSSLYRELVGKKLVLRYATNAVSPAKEKPLAEQFAEALSALAEKEKVLGQTLVGPHRDDFLFIVEGEDLRYKGSRGEVRAAVLALKLAEAKLLEKMTGERTIFFLDDVFSEFDPQRRRALALYLEERQSFVTSAEPELKLPGRTFLIEQGRLRAADY